MTKKRVVRQKKKGPIDPSVGLKVRELRTARKMTQAQLAGPDFSKGFISLLETGRTRISLRAAEILASRLGVPVTDFFRESPTPQYIPDPNLDDYVNDALEKLHELHVISSLVSPVELLLKEVFQTHGFLRGKLDRLVKHFAKMPDPHRFAPTDLPKFIQTYRAWQEELWRIANEQKK